MAYTNSSLVSYTKISPNKTINRNHPIDTITIHCVVGQCTAESLGNHFANPSLGASSNYGVDRDGRIGLYVEEKDRSYCTSNAANDHRAITIEVASDTSHPYAVTNAAYEALIKLVADICKRNNIKKLVWSTNKFDRVNHINGCNMTVHRDYANKSCPGQYLYDRHGDIANRVNKILGVASNNVTDTTDIKPKFEVGDEIKLVSGAKYTTGRTIPDWVLKSTLYVRDIDGDNITISVLKTGAITGVVNAKYIVNNTQTQTKPSTTETSKPTSFSIGDEVKLIAGAKYTSGKSIAPFVFNEKLYVRDIDGDNITISVLKTGAITGVVNAKYLVAYNTIGSSVSASKFTPYTVKVEVDMLNIYKGAGTNYGIGGSIKNGGVYTIVEEAIGKDNIKWGLLKAYKDNRNGWIRLDYCKKI